MLPDNQTAASLYASLESTREPFLTKARRCAELTLPFVCPPNGMAQGQELPTPYQSLGARGTNNLAAKLLLSLLPPNTPFFKLSVDRFALKKISKDPKTKTALEEALSEIEQAAQTEIETSAARTTASEALVHLLVAGNGLIEVPSKGNLKFTRLDRYVMQRDPMGQPLLIIIKETVAPNTLPVELRQPTPPKAKGKTSATSANEPEKGKEKTVDIYTVCQREPLMWNVWQEIRGQVVASSKGTYKNGKLPFIPLRFFKVDGEDYGRGFIEQYLGDLISLESLSQSIVEGAQAAARVIFLCSPNGITDATTVAKADNGAVVPGREEDVKALQLGKFADFRTAYEEKQDISQRLKEAFLLMSGVQRNAERVTAEEVRALIQELETSLSGVYAVLAQEFQLPLATAFMERMASDGRLPTLPKKIVSPTIVTGVEALGRGNDIQKLRAFTADVQQTFGPEVFSRHIDVSEYFTRLGTALGLNIKGLVRPAEEVAAEMQQQQQQAQMQELATKLGPAAMKQLAPGQTQPA